MKKLRSIAVAIATFSSILAWTGPASATLIQNIYAAGSNPTTDAPLGFIDLSNDPVQSFEFGSFDASHIVGNVSYSLVPGTETLASISLEAMMSTLCNDFTFSECGSILSITSLTEAVVTNYQCVTYPDFCGDVIPTSPIPIMFVSASALNTVPEPVTFWLFALALAVLTLSAHFAGAPRGGRRSRHGAGVPQART